MDDLDQVFHDIPPRVFVDDDRGGQVAEDPGTSGLNGVQILLLIEEQLDNQVPALGVVEKHKQRPVDEPGFLLETLQGRPKGRLVDKQP